MSKDNLQTKTVIRVRWRVQGDNDEHLLTFTDDDWGLEEAGKFQDYLLSTGAMQVKLAREQQGWR